MSKPPAEKMKDPRDIRDKGYQHQCIRSLVTFLTESGYDRPIAPKILSAPTAKDFQYIFMFLYHQIDPSYEFQGKMEDEVPVLIRGLKYPFYSDISKSHLFAVGSMHAWPSILAMLTWMVELILVRSFFFDE
jgi:kinetochore protein NDC80